jgi:tetratricopeptide (TPR) repeat protein
LTKKAAVKNIEEIASTSRCFSIMKAAMPGILLALVTFLTYVNAWPNTLVLDDKLFANHVQFSDFSALLRYFYEDTWAAKGGSGGLYRPVLFVSIFLDASLFGDWFAGYHLVNVLLHVILTLLVYVFVTRLLVADGKTADSSAYVAFLAALVFGIHPMHTEVVNSIFNRSVMLAAMGSMVGLWWLLRFLGSHPRLAWSGLFLAYLFALFCRETAIVLPGLAAVLVLVYSSGNLPTRVLRCMPVVLLLIPMTFYLVMRDKALSSADLGPKQIESSISTIAAQVDPSRLFDREMILDAAGTWVEAYRVLLWPYEPKISYPDSPRYLQFIGSFVHLGLLAIALFQFRRGNKGLLTGLMLFYIAILPSSRLFGAGSFAPHLRERYLYMPSVGLTVLLAYALSYLNLRFDRLLTAAPVVLAVFLLTPVTWARNAEWSDEVTLFESDFSKGVNTSYLLELLTAAHLRKSDFERVIEICEAQPAEQKKSGMFITHCASAYSYSGRFEEAEKAYLVGTKHKASRGMAHSNLAQHYMRQGRWDDAKIQFEKAVEAEKRPADKAYRKGYMLVHLYTNDRAKLMEARDYFEEALLLQPRLRDAQSWLNRLNQALGDVPESQQ